VSFFGELSRRNVFRVGIAYLAAVWVLIEVIDTIVSIINAPTWIPQGAVFSAALGFPLALLLAWFYELTPEGVKATADVGTVEAVKFTGRKIDFAIIGLLVIAVGFLLIRSPLDDQAAVLPNSVAVLPLDNLSPDPDNAYFASGLHEEILNQLAKLSNVNVISRTSVLQYAESRPPIQEIAGALNVQSVMEGSVRYAGDRIRVTTQLIDPRTGAHLWSATYDRDFNDIFAIESDIAMNIANALEAEFSPDEQERIEMIPTESPKAYALYLQALSVPTEAAQPFLDQAIDLDPEFALAYAARALCFSCNLLGLTGANPAEATDFERRAQEDVKRALELDSTLGQAHAALAAIHYANWDATEAEAAFEKAHQLSSDPSIARDYGQFKRYRGEFDAAIQLQSRAHELDPNNRSLSFQLGLSYSFGGYFREADSIFQELLKSAPAQASLHLQIGRVAVHLGNRQQALSELRLAEGLWQGIESDAFRVGQLVVAYSQAASPEDASRWFDVLQELERREPVGKATLAEAYLAMGNKERALQHLTAAVADGSSTDLPTLTLLAANPWGDPVLDEPEFRELLDGLWE